MADRASSADLKASAGRNSSPDSVIYTAESNSVSLFSSATASVDRCSFASDGMDLYSFSEIAQHLAEHESCGRECLSGPVLDLPETNKHALHSSADIRLLNKAVISKVKQVDDNRIPLHFDEEVPALNSAKKSLSHAHEEFKERRLRSDMLTNKLQRRRPASLDLHSNVSNIASSSPEFGRMQKSMNNSWKSGNFPSPETSNYHHVNREASKGWSSERVPLHSSVARKQIGSTTLTFNSCKTLPSKWEDAERWIFRPATGNGVTRPLYQQSQRRIQSKSGPIGPPGIAYYSLHSPAILMHDRSHMNNLTASSPFSTGVLIANKSWVRTSKKDGIFSKRGDPCIARSASVHGCKDLVCQTYGIGFGDEEVVEPKDTTAIVCTDVARRNMATQMSPVNRSHSSPKISSSSSMKPINKVQSSGFSPPEVRDVQFDERVTIGRGSKKTKPHTSSKGSGDVDSWELRSLGARSTPWDASDRSKSLSKATTEEAKITAWESLQKGKAEAAIRNLEMKQEKKRSTSMDKIMSKLRSAQRKARERRSSVSTNESNQVSKFSFLSVSFSRTRQTSSLSGCFTCHAF